MRAIHSVSWRAHAKDAGQLANLKGRHSVLKQRTLRSKHLTSRATSWKAASSSLSQNRQLGCCEWLAKSAPGTSRLSASLPACTSISGGSGRLNMTGMQKSWSARQGGPQLNSCMVVADRPPERGRRGTAPWRQPTACGLGTRRGPARAAGRPCRRTACSSRGSCVRRGVVHKTVPACNLRFGAVPPADACNDLVTRLPHRSWTAVNLRRSCRAAATRPGICSCSSSASEKKRGSGGVVSPCAGEARWLQVSSHAHLHFCSASAAGWAQPCNIWQACSDSKLPTNRTSASPHPPAAEGQHSCATGRRRCAAATAARP